MNLEHLAPAPWVAEWRSGSGAYILSAGGVANRGPLIQGKQTDAEFCALARNAFDVMLRRGWWAQRDCGCDLWRISWNTEDCVNGRVKSFPWWKYEKQTGKAPAWPDPFTALIEADAWYKANVEKGSP